MTRVHWALVPLGIGVVILVWWLYLLGKRRVNARVFDTAVLKCVQTGRTERAIKLTRAVPGAIYAVATRAALEAMKASSADAEERRRVGSEAFDASWAVAMRALSRDRWLCLSMGLMLVAAAAVEALQVGATVYWMGALLLVPVGLALEHGLKSTRAGFDGMVGQLAELIAKEPPAEAPVKTKPAPAAVKAPFRVQSDVHDPCARCGGMRIAQLDGVSIDGMPAARLVAYFCRDCGTGLFEVDPADLPAGEDVRGMPRRKPN